MTALSALLCIASLLILQATSTIAKPPPSNPLATEQFTIRYPSSTSPSEPSSDSLKVPGQSPAYYCSDPSADIFEIMYLDFFPKQPRLSHYLVISFGGIFKSDTGDVPWLNIPGSINYRPELSPMYDAPLCDLDVFQDISVPRPGDGPTADGSHRSCPPSIHKGPGKIQSPPIPIVELELPRGRYKMRAEAMTQDERRIFCTEGEFDILD